jgi:predicted dehydrogenase
LVAATEARLVQVHRISAALDARFEFVAGAPDADPGKGRALASQLGVSADRAYGDRRELLASERDRPDRVDLVTVATPNATHYQITRTFLEAGINVLCEKLMTNANR